MSRNFRNISDRLEPVEEMTPHRHWRVRHPEGLDRPRTFKTAAAAQAWRDRCADDRWIVEYVFRHQDVRP